MEQKIGTPVLAKSIDEPIQNDMLEQKGFSPLIILLIVGFIVVLVGYFYTKNNSAKNDNRTPANNNAQSETLPIGSDFKRLYEKVKITSGSIVVYEETAISKTANTLKSKITLRGREVFLDYSYDNHTSYDTSNKQKVVTKLGNSTGKNDNAYYARYIDLLSQAKSLNLLETRQQSKSTEYTIFPKKLSSSGIHFIPQVYAGASPDSIIINVDGDTKKITKVHEVYGGPDTGTVLEFEDVIMDSDTEPVAEIPATPPTKVVNYFNTEESHGVFELNPFFVTPLDNQSSSYSSQQIQLIFKTDLYDQFWKLYSANDLEGETPQVYIQVNGVIVKGQKNLGFNEVETALGKAKTLFFNLPAGMQPGYIDILVHFMNKNYILEKALLITSPLQNQAGVATPDESLSIGSIDDFGGSVTFDSSNRPSVEYVTIRGTGFQNDMEVKIGQYKADKPKIVSSREVKIFIPLDLKSGYYDLTITKNNAGVNQTATKPSFLLVTGSR